MKTWLQGGTILVPIVLSIYLVGTYFWNRANLRKEPATFSLAEYIRVPDYGKSVGEIHQIHADLRRVLGVVPRDPEATQHAPIVIFIDDLDRCSPGKVASVVEGVSMLLASDTYRCMFIIGMDPQMVAAALEKAHEDVRKQLPRYERTVPLGWRFMDKFIQLPFTIPHAATTHFDRYIDWLSDTIEPAMVRDGSAGAKDVRDRGPQEAAAGEQENGSRESPLQQPPLSIEQSTNFAESRDVGVIIRTIAKDSAGNPREMKRMINLARFYLALRSARRNNDERWRAPAPAQYARWILVTLRWPDMMRWLQWGADEANWGDEGISENLVVRRLRKLEEVAAYSCSLNDWKKLLEANLIVPIDSESDWACDPKLFEFFKAENSFPIDKRLSAAALRGFW